MKSENLYDEFYTHYTIHMVWVMIVKTKSSPIVVAIYTFVYRCIVYIVYTIQPNGYIMEFPIV